jgi:acetyl/propionyl-CoA carboxylase alpha subunit
VRPGYGVVAENAHFARQVIAADDLGRPDPEATGQMTGKIRARNLMERAGVPVSWAPGSRSST